MPDIACGPIYVCACGYGSSRPDNFAAHCAKFNEVDSDKLNAGDDLEYQ